MSDKTRMWCGCESNNCPLSILIPTNEAENILNRELIFIVEGCKMGANPIDNRVGGTEDYSLYEEQ